MPQRFQLRISTLLLITALVAMGIIIGIMQYQIASLKSQLSSDATTMPIDADLVAADVERYLASHPLPCSVTEVRYSENDDTYKIGYKWTNPKDQKTWFSTVLLKGNGFGEYAGCISNPEFLAPIDPPRFAQPLAAGDGMWIGVSTQ